MAEGKDIPLIITVDTAKSIKTIGELKKGIADTRKELEKTEVGSKRFNELSESIKTAEGRLGDLNKKATALKDMPGPIGAIAMGFDNVKTAVMTGARALMTFTGLLAATGIGLLLVAVSSLMAYFKGTEDGAQRLRVIMAVLGAVMDQLKDVFIGLGKAMMDAFDNPKKSWEDFKTSLSDGYQFIKGQVVDRMIATFTLMKNDIVSKILEMRIAWNELSGDAEEADGLRVALKEVNKESEQARDTINKLNKDASDVYNGLKNSVGDWVDNTKKVVTETELLENAMNRVKVVERELKVERAETNKELVKQRQIGKDIRLSLDERIAALTRANEIEAVLMEKELANERERLRIMAAKADLASSDEATLDAIADQRVKVANIEEASLMKRLELGEQLNTLRNAEAAEAKRIADEAAAAEAERLKIEFDLRQQLRDSEIALIANAEQQELERSAEAFQRRMDAIIGESEIEGELRDSLLDERLAAEQAIRDKYSDARKAKEIADGKELAAADEKLFRAKVAAAQAVGNALSTLSSVIQGESEAAVAARKTLAIAEIAISTAVAIAGAIKTATSGSSSPWEMIAGIAAGVATVIANIATATQILNSANVGGGSAPSPPSAASVSAPVIAPVTTNTTQLGNTEQAELAPIQAYVVETQITGSQGNVNQIESQATFGGG